MEADGGPDQGEQPLSVARSLGVDADDPASPPSTDVRRTPLHTRTVVVDGHARSDGLFEVVGRLLDTKPCDFTLLATGRRIPAGQAVHDMRVTLVFDADLVVRAVQAESPALPYAGCAAGPATLQAVVGLCIARNWTAEVRRRLAGTAGCAHLVNLLGPMGAAAFQSLATHRMNTDPSTLRPPIDTCLAYARDGALVRERYPEHAIVRGPRA